MKEVQVAVNNKDVEAAKVACAFACKKLDKAVVRGVYHKNNVARQKSSLAKALNQMA